MAQGHVIHYRNSLAMEVLNESNCQCLCDVWSWVWQLQFSWTMHDKKLNCHDKHLRDIGKDSSSYQHLYFQECGKYCLCQSCRELLNYSNLLLLLQKDNNGIVMVNFYSSFINCTDPDAATVEQVAGKSLRYKLYDHGHTIFYMYTIVTVNDHAIHPNFHSWWINA